MAGWLVAKRCHRPMVRATALALAVAAAAMAAVGSPAFASGRRSLVPAGRAALLAAPTLAGARGCATIRFAEEAEQAERPPADSELADEAGDDPRPFRQRNFRKYRPKREIRGTLCYARRELNEEAERLRPYLEPLLEQQMSAKEMAFVLNRNGAKLRPLLYRPRLGLPIFTEHKVKRLLRRAGVGTPRGRLHKFMRPRWLPAKAPGAPYPPHLEDVYAEVPPLKPWP